MADVDASVSIFVGKNYLIATADFIPREGFGKSLSEEDVLARISDAGIKVGINMDNIRTMYSSARPLKGVMIAEAVKPGVGENARIEPYVSLKRNPQARERNDGSVDFHDLGEIRSISKGEKLYRKIPPAIGNPGYDVMGNEIPGLPGKDLRIVLGNGTEFDPSDPNLVIATSEGELILRGGVLHLSELHDVKGDVDFSTGNVIFKGSIKIGGSVRSGFSVEAGGNIQIFGNVEDAVVTAGGDVIILGGFAGTGHGIVKSGGDITVKFVENQRVEAARDIIIKDVSYHAQMRAGRSVIAREGKGTIVGGDAEAKYSVESLRFGSTVCVPTIIRLGVDPAIAERLKNIEAEIAAASDSNEKLEQSIVYLFKIKIDRGQLPPDKAALLEKLEEARKSIPERLAKLNEEKGGLLADREALEKAFASAEIAVYPNVKVYYGNQLLTVADTLGPSVIQLLKGEVIRLSK
jgi:uncharacterized protein